MPPDAVPSDVALERMCSMLVVAAAMRKRPLPVVRHQGYFEGVKLARHDTVLDGRVVFRKRARVGLIFRSEDHDPKRTIQARPASSIRPASSWLFR
jgi:glutamine phosphoribosylpyrophosphate amidotransferase